ncbi:hypothetical protein PQY04_001648 [Salmonella enterica]|uniref:Uncharacterized protein n=1 Tax=Salmonella enterica TaxID=28901 RepID=A0A3J3E915_SALER|nr:hypothetical protein [Salmonella enterica]ECU4768819.1 hypothetical protein [Salmonella enterica subsp. enterica]EDQ1017331.1 hypothetical protein [Salmonella enterica subsp. houtenae serovar 50:z4,z23:-]EDV3252728.1 hypothetical protein [Salmonella enterica subsp. houtenae]EDW0441129.1 hypothetical protein [Salmonella enterica subsp. arizonae serovar 50:z4,z23:-]EHM2355289.1 hypothetical protein [Salmonella enterica subsp. enterica serovar Bonariensis]HAE7875582.1 hypothetical protein [Sa
MQIDYQDGGSEARLIITSWFFDWREHNRLVDEMLLRVPHLRAEDEGFLWRTTVMSGLTAYVLCAEVIAEENGFEVRRAGM